MRVCSLPPGFSASGEGAESAAPVRGGLVFDMDGTLYSHAAYLASQTELPLRRLARLRGKTYEAMRAEFDACRAAWKREHRDETGGLSMGNAFRAFGISIAENVKWREELYEPERYLAEDRRLREVLLRLSGGAGEDRPADSPGALPRFLLAVLTNNPVSVARRTLRCLGVEDCFSVVIGLDTCMVSKPHRVPFQRAAESLGLPLERCVSIGDRYEIDIALPLEMGMGGVLVDGVEDVYTLPELLLGA